MKHAGGVVEEDMGCYSSSSIKMALKIKLMCF